MGTAETDHLYRESSVKCKIETKLIRQSWAWYGLWHLSFGEMLLNISPILSIEAQVERMKEDSQLLRFWLGRIQIFLMSQQSYYLAQFELELEKLAKWIKRGAVIEQYGEPSGTKYIYPKRWLLFHHVINVESMLERTDEYFKVRRKELTDADLEYSDDTKIEGKENYIWEESDQNEKDPKKRILTINQKEKCSLRSDDWGGIET